MPKLFLCLLLALPLSADVPSRHTIEGTAILRDFSHPRHAGDYHEERLRVTIAADCERDALVFTFQPGEGPADRFALRGTSLFEAKGVELTATESAGGLSASALARLDPLFVASMLHDERDSTHARGNDLWTIHRRDGRLSSIETPVHDDLYGDLIETVSYEGWGDRGGVSFPSRITVRLGDRLKIALDVTGVRAGAEDELLRGVRAREHAVYDEDIAFRELAPHLFAIELKPTDSRVFVAEFDDFVFVIEGAYDDRNVARIARRIAQRFAPKPIRYFSFSHIHGQYVGGVRTYAGAGATVLTTPTGAEVVKEIAASRHGRSGPMKIRTEVVAKSRTIEDGTNAMTIFNVDSQHTDDYFVFYFPRSKLLLAGDLLCYRGETTPLRGRSIHLCETIQALGIDVETITITWPLENYGCLSPVAFSDFTKACASVKP